jgi:hypothetical protein
MHQASLATTCRAMPNAPSSWVIKLSNTQICLREYTVEKPLPGFFFTLRFLTTAFNHLVCVFKLLCDDSIFYCLVVLFLPSMYLSSIFLSLWHVAPIEVEPQFYRVRNINLILLLRAYNFGYNKFELIWLLLQSKVNNIDIQYDKVSKQVDVHSLKVVLWNHIHTSAETDDQVMRAQLFEGIILLLKCHWFFIAMKTVS